MYLLSQLFDQAPSGKIVPCQASQPTNNVNLLECFKWMPIPYYLNWIHTTNNEINRSKHVLFLYI
jgi:hypothetical protein